MSTNFHHEMFNIPVLETDKTWKAFRQSFHAKVYLEELQ